MATAVAGPKRRATVNQAATENAYRSAVPSSATIGPASSNAPATTGVTGVRVSIACGYTTFASKSCA